MNADVTFSIHSAVRGSYYGWLPIGDVRTWRPLIHWTKHIFYSVRWHDGVRNQEIISVDFKSRTLARAAAIKRVNEIKAQEV